MSWTVIVFIVVCGVSSAQQGGRLTLEQLRREVRRSYEFADYDRTIELLVEYDRRAPGRANTAYTLACCYAMTGRKDEAIRWLRRSAELGFARHGLVTTTDDLERVRDEPGYAEAVAKITANAKVALARFKKTAPEPDPVVILPPGYDATRPAALIVSLHGYGATPPPVAEVWRKAATEFGAIVIAPQAVHKVRNAGYQWGVLEEAEFLVLRAIEHARSGYAVDPKRIVLTGFSQGAHVALELGLRHPELFRGVVPVCGGSMLGLSPAPPREALPRFFFMAGGRDGTLKEMKRAASVLQASGATARIVVHRDTAHHFPKDSVAATREALAFVLRED